MENNTCDTLPQYLVPEGLTLDDLDAYIIVILLRYEAGNITQEDLLNRADALEEFLWKKYGDRETLIFPVWETNAKFRMCSYVIDWMSGSNELGYLITKKDVSILIDFLNKPPTHGSEEKESIQKHGVFRNRN